MSSEDGGPSRQGEPTARHTFRLIQVLRAVAALMVIAFHATVLVSGRLRLPMSVWRAGASGVALFFVISGFVMTVSSAPLRSVHQPVPHPARIFLARRFQRIVPLYWIATTLKVLAVWAFPAVALGGLDSLTHTLGSFAFLPVANRLGVREPVLVVGWTLNFELFFYLLFAATLAVRASLSRMLVPVLCLLAALGLLLPPHALSTPLGFYTNPLVLDFAFGIVLSLALPRLQHLPALSSLPWISWLALLMGFAILCVYVPPSTSAWSGILWGLPACLVVAAALSLEPQWGARIPRWTLELGDASYSLYLFHGFALPLLALLLRPSFLHYLGHGYGAAHLGFTLAVLLSVAVGEAAYRLIERPLLSWLRGRRHTAIPANT